MLRPMLATLFACAAGLLAAAQAQAPANPLYYPNGANKGYYGYPLQFGNLGVSYNFAPGRVREFTYGLYSPTGVFYGRNMGSPGAAFNVGASPSPFFPDSPNGNLFGASYSSPLY